MGVERISTPLAEDELAQAAERLRKFTQAVEFIEQNWSQLVSRYPDQWVAATASGVVASNHQHEDLLCELDAGGIDRDSVVVRFVATKPDILIL